jgi:hypothetical protein
MSPERMHEPCLRIRLDVAEGFWTRDTPESAPRFHRTEGGIELCRGAQLPTEGVDRATVDRQAWQLVESIARKAQDELRNRAALAAAETFRRARMDRATGRTFLASFSPGVPPLRDPFPSPPVLGVDVHGDERIVFEDPRTCREGGSLHLCREHLCLLCGRSFPLLPR